MMKRLNSCLFLLTAILLAGCGKQDAVEAEPPIQKAPIGFSSPVVSQTQTRGNVITSITEMYIFASYTGQDNWESASHSFNYMYDQYANNPGSGWTYSPVKYWPDNAEDKISFFAYAPTEARSILSVSTVNTVNPTITYTVPAKESEQLDFLVASQLNCTNTTGNVSFSMQHALTQVVVKVKNGDASISNITLSAIKVIKPGVGTLTFNDTGNTADKAFSWAATDTKEISADVAVTTNSNATFFLLPVGDPSSTVKFQVTYKLTKSTGHNSGESPSMTAFFVPPATPAWTAGKVLTYNLSVIDDRLEINSITVTDFDANGTSAGGNIPAT